MRNMTRRISLLALLLVVFCFFSTYTKAIELEEINFSKPEIVIFDTDGIVITEPNKVIDCNGARLKGLQKEGNLISVIKTNNITIKNCVFTGNTEAAIDIYESTGVVILNNSFSEIRKPEGMSYGGYSIMIKGGNNFIIKNNLLKNNEIGILVEGKADDYVDNVRMNGNTVTDTWMSAALKCHRCSRVTVADNYLESNGKPEFFEKQRIVGIDLHETHDSRIYNNTVIESSSDGIGITGEVWEGKDKIVFSYNVEVFENTVIDNGEQGIWTIASRDIQIYNNNITCTKYCYTGCSGIFFEWNVSNSEIRDNEISGRGNKHTGITIESSYSNKITNNSIKNIGTGILVAQAEEGGQVMGEDGTVLEPIDPIDNIIAGNKIDAWEEFIRLDDTGLDDESNIVRDNINLRKTGTKNQHTAILIIITIAGVIFCVIALIKKLRK